MFLQSLTEGVNESVKLNLSLTTFNKIFFKYFHPLTPTHWSSYEFWETSHTPKSTRAVEHNKWKYFTLWQHWYEEKYVTYLLEGFHALLSFHINCDLYERNVEWRKEDCFVFYCEREIFSWSHSHINAILQHSWNMYLYGDIFCIKNKYFYVS